MRNRCALGLVGVIAVALGRFPHAVSAQTVVDQYDLVGDINWAIHSGSDIGQVWPSGTTGQLIGTELALSRCASPTDPAVLEILSTNGGVPQPSPVLASVAIPEDSIPLTVPPTSLVLGSTTGPCVDLAVFGISLQAGSQYAFRISIDGGNCYAVRGDTASNYPGGQRFTQWTLQTSDLVSKTFNQNIELDPASSSLSLALFPVAIAAAVILLRR